MLLTRLKSWAAENRSILIVLGLLLLIFIAFRTTPSDVAASEFESVVSGGQPSVVEFYSNY